MKIMDHKELVKHIKDHLESTGEKPATFGRRVLGDSGAIFRLYNGTNPRLETVNKIMKAIEEDNATRA